MRVPYLLGAGGLGLLVAAVGLSFVMRSGHLRAVRRVRRRLESRGGGDAERFREDMVADLPEPARRYFLHAIRPGTGLADTVVLEMSGEIRLQPDGRWLPMQARQIVAPPDGFVWEAAVGRGVMRFSGADHYADGSGRTAFRLWDLVPVAQASSPDVSRSARGRLALEAIFTPAALLARRGVAWETVDEQIVRATLTVDGEPIRLSLTVEPDGRLRSVSGERWGSQTDDGRFALIPFGAYVLGERTFGGYTIPSRIQAGWWFDTERYFDFFHALIENAIYQ